MTTHTLRWKPLLIAGALSGLLQVTAGVAMYLAGFYFDPRSMLVSLAVLVTGIVLGTGWYRRHAHCGRLTYKRALLVGGVIGVCTGLLYAAYNIITIGFVYPDFLQELMQAQQARLEAQGLSPNHVQTELASIQARTTAGTVALINLLSLSVLGAGVSAVVAIRHLGTTPDSSIQAQ